MRKVLIFLTIASIMCFMLAPGVVLAADPVFTDVGSHWAREDIARLAAQGCVTGYGDGTFRPNEPMSRAGFITALVSCLGIKPTDTSTRYFSDTSRHWGRGYINAAVKRGILIPGEYPGGLKPDGALKRSEAAAMMVRALGKGPRSGDLPFKDRATLARSMYRGYIKTAYDEQLISGYTDGEFKPFATVNRAQACVMLSRFLDKMGGSGATTPVSPPANAGQLASLVIGDCTYNLRTAPVYFKMGTNNVRVTALSTSTGYVHVNNLYRLPLDSSTGDLEIAVYNNRCGVERLSVRGNSLVVTPSYLKIATLAQGGYVYRTEFVKLYLGTGNSNYYLGDADLVSQYAVRVGGKSYDLTRDKVTIALGDKFYAVRKVVFGSGDTSLELEETSPVVVERPVMADISAIFVDSSTLNLNTITSLEFIIEGTGYRLSDVTIDAAGNFTVGDTVYPASRVTLVANNNYYRVNHAQMHNGKFVFYCTGDGVKSWVNVDGKYRDSADVQVLKDGIVYSLDSVLVVQRNVVRIKGRQYNLDSTFKCRIDNKIYNIEKIDYDTSRQMTVITTGEATGYGAGQPSKYTFYLNGTVYQEGANTVMIYAGGGWRSLSSVLVSDPAHFSFGGSSYDLIGARVRVKDVDFTVTDTAWHGRTLELDVYLQKL